jgi:hypothetical protein
MTDRFDEQVEGYRTAWADASQEREQEKDKVAALTKELAEARKELAATKVRECEKGWELDEANKQRDTEKARADRAEREEVAAKRMFDKRSNENAMVARAANEATARADRTVECLAVAYSDIIQARVRIAELEAQLGQALKRMNEQQAIVDSKLFDLPLERVAQLEKELAEAREVIAGQVASGRPDH